MKVAVSIPDRVFAAAESAAKRRRVSRSRFYTEAIETYLRTSESADIGEALREVYSTESSAVDRVLAELQARALREDW